LAHVYSQRFGLYHWDFATHKRILLNGSEAMRDFSRSNTVE